jgi:deoxyribonuclease-1
LVFGFWLESDHYYEPGPAKEPLCFAGAENRGLRMRASVLLICLLLSALPVARAAEPSGYLAIIPTFWAELYPEGGSSLYCGEPFARYARKVNIEHVFPMAWATRALRCGSRKQCRESSPLFNRIEADMHNLFPALRQVNKARGAMAYAEIPGEDWLLPGCDLEIDRDRRRVEPRPAVRGDIARAMFYMAFRYGLEIYPRQRTLLQAWHRADPPDAGEQQRNAVIERLQGSRNPFIDEPERLPR